MMVFEKYSSFRSYFLQRQVLGRATRPALRRCPSQMTPVLRILVVVCHNNETSILLWNNVVLSMGQRLCYWPSLKQRFGWGFGRGRFL